MLSYKTPVVSDFAAKATLYGSGDLSLKAPKINIKTMGKRKLKNMEEGWLKIALKLAFVIAHNARD